MNIAVILAGGIGARVGADIPKQFIEVLGKPVLVYTIEKFQEHSDIDAIEVVCVESHYEYMNALVEKYHLTKVKWITIGGSTFQESVRNGIYNLKDKVKDDDIAVVHFGASPFVEADLISDTIRVSKDKGNAISTTPFYLLSGYKDDEEYSCNWIDRETIVCMNSPHAFKYSFIYDIYKEAEETGIINEVEPHTTTLMYKMGKKIYFSKGSQTNIKITTKEDLDLFEGHLLMKERRKNEENC